MINKEIILNADGSIKKDFVDRNIPQNSNNQVSVNVLIPSQCFTGLQNYAVLLAVSRIISNVETTLNTLVMSVAKSITIDGVVYVKYTAYLDIGYTDKIGQLKLSPYIQTTAETTSGGTTTTIISIQQSFTNSNLNVIKSVLPQYDASLEDANIASTIIGMVEGKKIYTFIDDATSDGEHYYNLVDGFNPSADQFNGCLVVSVYDNATTFIMPYLVGDNVELLEITKDGKFYRISGVSYANDTYSYTRTQLSYSKSEIDTKESAIYDALDTKVNKTQKVNGHALSGDITLTKGDVGLGNVANYGVETTPTASGEYLYITSKAVYDALQAIYGILANMPTEEVVNTINSRLDAIETLIGDSDGDNDNIINTLKEVIAILSGLGEDANILSMINSKANQTDFNALNSQINGEDGIADKVDTIYARTNAYAEIKNSVGTIDIAVSDWVANTGDSEYPYKYELTNGYLEGAVNCIVVYSKDSDTSMLSATTGIDEVNGKLVIYASEIPSATISIEKIAVFNDLNSYINYSNEIVQQVLSNTSAISDINNVKLPQYVKGSKQEQAGTTTLVETSIKNTNDNTLRQVKLLYRKQSGTSVIERSVIVDEDGITATTKSYSSSSSTTTHTLTFDANGDLKIDGNAVGGGGKQLYQHNLCFYIVDAGDVDAFLVYLKIINDSATPMTKADIYNWLIEKGFKENETNIVSKKGWHKGYYVNGIPSTASSGSGNIKAIIASTNTTNRIYAIQNSIASYTDLNNVNNVNDIVITL